jgi:hypothetical protein
MRIGGEDASLERIDYGSHLRGCYGRARTAKHRDMNSLPQFVAAKTLPPGSNEDPERAVSRLSVGSCRLRAIP